MDQNSKNKNISKLLDAMKISDKLMALRDKVDSEEAKPFLIRGKTYKPEGNKIDSESENNIIFSVEFLMFADFVLIENRIVKDRNDMFEYYLCDLELLKKSHKNVLIQKDGVLEIYTNKENRTVFDNIISKIDIDKETLNRRVKIYEK